MIRRNGYIIVRNLGFQLLQLTVIGNMRCTYNNGFA